jgi:outer membrane lipoprotein SlyB
MKAKLLVCLPVVMMLASCAQDSMSGDVYAQRDVRMMQTVHSGRVTKVRLIRIQGEREGGTMVGGVSGALLGSTIGRGCAANTAGAIGGALLGGVIGSHAAQEMGSRNGVEITVRQDQGGTVAVVQELNPREYFYVGDRVQVIATGARARVTH